MAIVIGIAMRELITEVIVREWVKVLSCAFSSKPKAVTPAVGVVITHDRVERWGSDLLN